MTWDAPVGAGAEDEWEYAQPEGSPVAGDAIEVLAEESAPTGAPQAQPEPPAGPEAEEEVAPEKPRRTAPEPEAPRQPDEWRRAIEAVLMAATEPVEPQVLAQLIERPVA
ncbi:MAG: hypothetical protein QOF96_230, partial [Actinomycetota bacterium]|nr:hypothetical protein [Actinomycetota bacterium]